MRQSLFCAALVAALAAPAFTPTAFAPTAFAGDYADQKVVYHNSGGDEGYFTRLLGNISNHIEAVGADHVEIVVVDHGNGLDLFETMENDPKIAKRVAGLRDKGVRFLICRKTLEAREIDWRTLPGVQEADIVPSGVAEIAKLEGEGFAYIHP